MQGCQVLNPTTQLQQLSVTTDRFCGIHLWEYLHGMQQLCYWSDPMRHPSLKCLRSNQWHVHWTPEWTLLQYFMNK